MNTYSPEFLKFLAWEQASRDTIDFKKVYVDVVDDLIAGLALSELIYWYLPDKSGEGDKLRVEHDGQMWIACRRYEWWERTRMSPKQADRAIVVLKKRGIIVTKVYKFSGSPTVHIRLNQDRFLKLLWEVIDSPPENPFFPKGGNGNSPNGKNEIPPTAKTTSPRRKNRNSSKGKSQFPQMGRSLTETTPPIPTETTTGEGERPGQSGQVEPTKTPAPASKPATATQGADGTKEIRLYHAVMGRSPTKKERGKAIASLGTLSPELCEVAPEYLGLYQAITGNELGEEVNVNQWPLIVTAIHQLPPDKRTRDYLLPFWQKWCAISASAYNVEWLTDCAVNGRLPGSKKKPSDRNTVSAPPASGSRRRYASERYKQD